MVKRIYEIWVQIPFPFVLFFTHSLMERNLFEKGSTMTTVTTYSTNSNVNKIREAAGRLCDDVHWATIDLPLGTGTLIDIAANAMYKTIEFACDTADSIIGFEVKEEIL